MTALTMTSVSKSYGRGKERLLALRKVSLQVGAGEFIAIRGPSGCGKTTLLLIAGGLLTPDEGKVFVAGQDLHALAPERRAHFRAAAVGFVFQQFHLIPYLNVLENVMAAELAMPIPDARGRAEQMLVGLNLAGRLAHLPGELSTGERQRVAVARALLANPRLVLADEPTGSLDEDNGRMVMDALAAHATGGGAVLTVTHDRGVSSRAQRVYDMADGELNALAT